MMYAKLATGPLWLACFLLTVDGMTPKFLATLVAALVSAPALADDAMPFQAEVTGLPQVDATLAPDGHFTLVLRADVAWSQAEVVVGGSPAFVLGPSEAGFPVRVDGVTDSQGPLDISLVAVDAGSRGIQWMFTVEPAAVPATAPPLTSQPHHRRRWFRRIGDRG